MNSITPAMRQYLDIKAQNPDSIVLFRMGDFYEMFFDDAKVASRILGIALTSRDREREIPMCGVPYHAAKSYIAKLVRDGHKVAVCEQFSDTEVSGKKIFERAVTRVITPGIAFEDELLEPKSNNFIAAAFLNDKKAGFAYMDVSTGEFRLTELAGLPELADEIRRIRPLELLIPPSPLFNSSENPVKKITELQLYDFDLNRATERLTGHFGTTSLDGFGCAAFKEAVRAAGALLHYIKETQRSDLSHVRSLNPYFTHDYLIIDHQTRRNLEIDENLRSGGREGTLLSLLDRTRTAMGGRLLRSWLIHPLKDVSRIKDRRDAVGEFLEEGEARRALQGFLEGIYDLERLMVRLTLGIANPRDAVCLKNSLKKVPDIKEMLSSFNSCLIREAASSIDGVPEATRIIEAAIIDSPPLTAKDGGVIKSGYSRDLDCLREIGSGGKDWIARLESEERNRTGINSLKVGYNRVFGYYIEVTNANLGNVPPEYTRKQTLVNAERFITPSLKEWEDKILTAEEKAKELEAALFAGAIEEVSVFSERVVRTAEKLSIIDALISLADCARDYNYTKPDVNDGDAIKIEDGRHPVIEANLQGTGFVANDLAVDNSSSQILILTGPNMAGKSTYLRQNALIVLMAQIGSFVPSGKAVIGVADRIFTRVGASDDLSRGQSTFMVEMNETANILNNATPKSLVILDEIGRGTSTFDGLSIAWAVVEYLHDRGGVRAKTLFATHYHELTELSLTKERVKNYNMAVKEWNDKVIFLRKVLPGGSNRSYGIQVARLAGLPGPVIERAKEILKNLESGELNESGMPRIAARDTGSGPSGQLNLPAGEFDAVREELERMDVNNMTPIEALTALNKLKEIFRNRR